MRWLRRILFALIVLLVLIFLGGWWLLAGSEARLDGNLVQASLSIQVQISRDHLGIATIEAGNRRDLSFALGFIHAQERFFQMDLMRRIAAGELAELVGAPGIKMDLNHRQHRFRARAQAAVATLPPEQRDQLAAYREGVNAGLSTLRVRPWEYLVLRAAPVPWRDEDCFLTVDSMFLDLNEDGTNERELRWAQMRAALPPEIADFLMTRDGAWEAPLQGAVTPAPVIPGSGILDLRAHSFPIAKISLPGIDRPGSNNFAVAGKLTGAGAIVANDMHLSLRVPGIWFRARLRYPDPQMPDRSIDANGVTLPGMPALIAGSNGHIAWGFTNSYGDWLDWVRVQRDSQDSSKYRTSQGWNRVELHQETIQIRGASPRTLDVEETIWGPIMGKDIDGTSLALSWIAHLPRTHNLGLLNLERIQSAHEALALAPAVGMPPQNFVVGDAAGNIGWTVTGNALPLRAGFDPALPADWSKPGTGWTGFAAPDQFPRIENPDEGRLWTANNRTTSDAWLVLLGDSGYDNGARAMQIRDDLRAHSHFTPADLLGVQLDDRALFLGRWQKLLQDELAKLRAPQFAELQKLTASWGNHASVAAVDYRLVRTFRLYVHESVLAPFVALAKKRFPDFQLPPMMDGEAPVWALLQARPVHLLDPAFADWEALLQSAAQKLLDRMGSQAGGLSARTWGERNTASIRHPLSSSLPGIFSRWLDMPPDRLPGDSHMPRVQGPAFGASERFGIMPGKEEQSYLHMPGGQSDHPLSPYHGVGHEDWASGNATPLLPGPAEHKLTLSPPK
jgi:penicillin G amidase